MSKALEVAHLAERADEVPVGAVLVAAGEIIGTGYNRRHTTGRTVAHAEILALEDYSQRASKWRVGPGVSLFVTAEPCLMCTGALLWARVENIYFGCPDPRQAGILRIHSLIEEGVFDHRFAEIRGGIMAESCAALLTEYFRMKRRRDTLSR